MGSAGMLNYEFRGYEKWKYTLYTAVIALLVFNQVAYRLVHRVLRSCIKVCSKCECKGCKKNCCCRGPTRAGLVIQVVLFALLLRGVMELDI